MKPHFSVRPSTRHLLLALAGGAMTLGVINSAWADAVTDCIRDNQTKRSTLIGNGPLNIDNFKACVQVWQGNYSSETAPFFDLVNNQDKFEKSQGVPVTLKNCQSNNQAWASIEGQYLARRKFFACDVPGGPAAQKKKMDEKLNPPAPAPVPAPAPKPPAPAPTPAPTPVVAPAAPAPAGPAPGAKCLDAKGTNATGWACNMDVFTAMHATITSWGTNAFCTLDEVKALVNAKNNANCSIWFSGVQVPIHAKSQQIAQPVVDAAKAAEAAAKDKAKWPLVDRKNDPFWNTWKTSLASCTGPNGDVTRMKKVCGLTGDNLGALNIDSASGLAGLTAVLVKATAACAVSPAGCPLDATNVPVK